MTVIIDTLLIVIAFQHLAMSSAGSIVTQFMFSHAGFDDLIFNDDVIVDVTARSRLYCASVCKASNNGCDAYTFVKESPETSSGSCRLYSGLRAVGSSTRSIGAITFAKKKKTSAWLKKTCTIDADCPGDLTSCYWDQCLCQPAAYYSNGADVCVESCEESDLRSTFVVYTDMDVRDVVPYIGNYDTNDVDQCQTDCVANSLGGECHAIIHDFGVDLYSGCWHVSSFVYGDTKDEFGWNLNKRTCA